MEHCFYHPDREAVAVCSKCGKPLCKECINWYNGKIYCKDCLEEIKKEAVTSKKIVITAIIVSALIIGGIILISVFTRNGKLVNKNPENAVGAVVLKSDSNLGSLVIRAEINKSSVNIVQSENGKIMVIGKNVRPSATLKGNTLTVKHSGLLGLDKVKNREITIYVPKTAKYITLNVKVNIGNTDISIPFSSIKEGEIETAIGSTTVENCNANQLKIAEGMGECRITGGTYGTLEVKEGTGDVEIASIKKIKELFLKGGAGEFSIDFSETEPSTNATIRTGIGETDITTGDKPARITVTAGLGVNDNSLPGANRTFTFGDLNKPYLKINVVSGGKVDVKSSIGGE